MAPFARWLALLVVLLVLAPAQAARVSASGPTLVETRISPGVSTDLELVVPFQTDANGSIYAKLLVTPWSPINSGVPNGTLAPGGGSGASGWWISFALRNRTADGTHREGALHELGAYVDDTPTPKVPLPAGVVHEMLVRIHVPEEGAVEGTVYRVSFSFALKLVSDVPGGASGGERDPSQAYTHRIIVAAPEPAASDWGAWTSPSVEETGSSAVAEGEQATDEGGEPAHSSGDAPLAGSSAPPEGPPAGGTGEGDDAERGGILLFPVRILSAFLGAGDDASLQRTANGPEPLAPRLIGSGLVILPLVALLVLVVWRRDQKLRRKIEQLEGKLAVSPPTPPPQNSGPAKQKPARKHQQK